MVSVSGTDLSIKAQTSAEACHHTCCDVRGFTSAAEQCLTCWAADCSALWCSTADPPKVEAKVLHC